jgi:serine/threonine protein kinase
MIFRCPSCSTDIADAESHVCPSCGLALSDSFAPTRPLEASPAAENEITKRKSSPPARFSSPVSFDSLEGARFAPGAILAERYRIIALLGQGGMGEVYRADDLKLAQPVALKFLPAHLSNDGASLARLYREVRVARDVSHRNVCRVYDIGEVAGHHFLSMEYIKGEELSSLLKRIGRLPADKAVEISRQICAGLSAAHERGVLHRDLKPANVMIDERGDARILDFGLAEIFKDSRAQGVIEGTPAYMSPEQLVGGDLTVRSDIYSLGLVLYEIFTGKRAFDAPTLQGLIEQREQNALPKSLSSLVKDVDPTIERVIERCLDRDPEKRPASALQVAAALPGGDPVAAALAAGETPSPEMVAAAPTEGALRPAIAISLLSAFFVLFILSLFTADRAMLHNRVPLDKPPEVLEERAREISRRAGYTQSVDSAQGFGVNEAYLRHVTEQDQSPSRWNRLASGRPAVVHFWHRQSPFYLQSPASSGLISFDEPPQNTTGMTGTRLDTHGRLIYFSAVPPQRDNVQNSSNEQSAPNEQASRRAPDWTTLFTEAGLDITNFRQVESRWVPPHAYDTRAAWEGVYPDQPDIPIRIEAAGYGGRAVYFEIIHSWDSATRESAGELPANLRALFALLVAGFLTVIVGSVILAWRNLRLGRGDRRGAFRVALFVFCVGFVGSLCGAHHVPTLSEWAILAESIRKGLFGTFVFGAVYLALEPFVRRRWPGRIVSWTRLLAGNFRDPLVGRDILIGAVFGTAMILTLHMAELLPQWLGWPPRAPDIEPAAQFLGLGYFGVAFTIQLNTGFLISFSLLFLFLLFAIVLRRDKLAVGVMGLLYSVGLSLANLDNPLVWLFVPLSAALQLFPLFRYGLLTMFSTVFFFHPFVFFPMTTRLTAWYATGFTLALIICVAIAIYAFHTSLAGQRLFREGFLQD